MLSCSPSTVRNTTSLGIMLNTNLLLKRKENIINPNKLIRNNDVVKIISLILLLILFFCHILIPILRISYKTMGIYIIWSILTPISPKMKVGIPKTHINILSCLSVIFFKRTYPPKPTRITMV